MHGLYGMASVRVVFACGVRGYDEYRTIWNPRLNEVLTAHHNPHDCFAVTVTKRSPADTVVGHLPREISRFTYSLIVHDARLSCRVVGVHHRRSPLIQGSLEIPVEVTVEMDISEENVLAMEKYKTLIKEHYQEPIDGRYPDATAAILQKLKTDSDDDFDEETSTSDEDIDD